MAKMIGKTLRIRQCPYECCGDTQDKHAVKLREKAEAFRFEEAADIDHPWGLCQDKKSGMLGCEYCYPDDLDDAYDNSDLDGIPGVWCNVDWRNDPFIQRLIEEDKIWETRLSQSRPTEADGA